MAGIDEAVVLGGSAILGGLANVFGSKKRSDSEYNRSKRAIQTRVADAKKAGIHPLFALGGSANYSPQFISGQSPLGGAARDVGAAVAGSMKLSREQSARQIAGLNAQPMQDAQKYVLNTEGKRNEAEALFFQSRTALNADTLSHDNDDPFSIFNKPNPILKRNLPFRNPDTQRIIRRDDGTPIGQTTERSAEDAERDEGELGQMIQGMKNWGLRKRLELLLDTRKAVSETERQRSIRRKKLKNRNLRGKNRTYKRRY